MQAVIASENEAIQKPLGLPRQALSLLAMIRKENYE